MELVWSLYTVVKQNSVSRKKGKNTLSADARVLNFFRELSEEQLPFRIIKSALIAKDELFIQQLIRRR